MGVTPKGGAVVSARLSNSDRLRIARLMARLIRKGTLSHREQSQLTDLLDPIAHVHASRVPLNLRDDALQEARLAIHRAVCTFKVGKNATIKTYANTCARNAVLSYLSEEDKYRRFLNGGRLGDEGASDDTDALPALENLAEPPDTAMGSDPVRASEAKAFDKICRQFETTLSEHHRLLFQRCVLGGEKQIVVAAAVCLPKQTVSDDMKRLSGYAYKFFMERWHLN